MILCAFVFAAGMVSAQTCTKAEKAACKKAGKTCVKTASTADSETKVASAMTVADIAAESDESIVRKVCDYSGSVSYYKKNVCEKSGKVSMAEVSYDEEAEAFVNVSPKDVMSDQEAKVVKASEETVTKTKVKKKACCAGKKAKSCSKSTEGA